MKFIATFEEVKNVLRNKYDLTNDVEVEITELPVSDKMDCVKFVYGVDCIPNVTSTNKIPAIKMVRTLIGGSLAEAKWIIEHWETYRNFVLTFRRYPVLSVDPKIQWGYLLS